MVLTCVPLMTNDTEHFYMCLLAICISTSEKHLFKHYTHFKILLLFCCLVKSTLFWILIPYQIYDLQGFFSYFVCCLFTFFINSFAQKFLILIKSGLSIFFSLVAYALGVNLRSHCQTPMSSMSFMALALLFRFLSILS